jgi:hypothetical protein
MAEYASGSISDSKLHWIAVSFIDDLNDSNTTLKHLKVTSSGSDRLILNIPTVEPVCTRREMEIKPIYSSLLDRKATSEAVIYIYIISEAGCREKTSRGMNDTQRILVVTLHVVIGRTHLHHISATAVFRKGVCVRN